MNLLEKTYYTIEEALKELQQHGININVKDLYYFGENGQLPFSLYVGTRPVLAAKYNQTTKDLRFIASCNIHGVFLLPQSDLCNVVANEKAVIEFISGNACSSNLIITNWSITLPKDILKAQLDLINLWQPETETYNNQLLIDFFYLKPDYFLQDNNTGSFLPYNLIPEQHAENAIKFNLGITHQIVTNQIFAKSDLRITKYVLDNFIYMIKENQNRRKTQNSEKLNEKDEVSLNDNDPETIQQRNDRLLNRAVEIYKSNQNLPLKSIHQQIVEEEKEKTNVSASSLKKIAKLDEIQKIIKSEK